MKFDVFSRRLFRTISIDSILSLGNTGISIVSTLFMYKLYLEWFPLDMIGTFFFFNVVFMSISIINGNSSLIIQNEFSKLNGPSTKLNRRFANSLARKAGFTGSQVLVTNILSITVILILNESNLKITNSTIIDSIIIGSLVLKLNIDILLSPFIAYYKARLKPVTPSLIDIFGTSISPLLIFLLYNMKFDIASIALGIVLSDLTRFALHIFYGRRFLKFWYTRRRRFEAPYFLISVWYKTLGGSISNKINTLSPKYLLYFLVSAEAVALYDIFKKVPEALLKLARLITRAAMPVISKLHNHHPEHNKKLKKWVIAYLLSITGIYLLVASQIHTILLSWLGDNLILDNRFVVQIFIASTGYYTVSRLSFLIAFSLSSAERISKYLLLLTILLLPVHTVTAYFYQLNGYLLSQIMQNILLAIPAIWILLRKLNENVS